MITNSGPRAAFMKGRWRMNEVKVKVVEFGDRNNYQMQWTDPVGCLFGQPCSCRNSDSVAQLFRSSWAWRTDVPTRSIETKVKAGRPRQPGLNRTTLMAGVVALLATGRNARCHVYAARQGKARVGPDAGSHPRTCGVASGLFCACHGAFSSRRTKD